MRGMEFAKKCWEMKTVGVMQRKGVVRGKHMISKEGAEENRMAATNIHKAKLKK